MSEKESKDDNVDKTAVGTQTVNLHLSDIFKNDGDYTKIKGKDINVTKKNLINKIIEVSGKIEDNKDKMVKIKLNGSYCKYFRISVDQFTQNDEAFDNKGTLDEKGVFVFTGNTEASAIAAEAAPAEAEAAPAEEEAAPAEEEAAPAENEKILVLLDNKEAPAAPAEAPAAPAEAENEQILVLLNNQDS